MMQFVVPRSIGVTMDSVFRRASVVTAFSTATISQMNAAAVRLLSS